MRSILGLVVRRLAGRPSSAALIAIALAAAIGVVGSIAGVAAVTRDRAAQDALEGLAARDRSVFVTRYAATGGDHAAADRVARAALQRLERLTEEPVEASIVRDPFRGPAVVAVDDLGRWLRLDRGDLPAPCAGTRCEAVVLVEEGTPQTSLARDRRVGGVDFDLVGSGTFGDAFPLAPPLDAAEVIVVEGVADVTSNPALAAIPRADFWVAPLDPLEVRGWTLEVLVDSADRTARDLALVDRKFSLVIPRETIAAVGERAATSGGRLVFIASLVVATLLAFAVFAAVAGRNDVAHEYRRLVQQGARRRHLAWFVLLEAGLPAAVGAVAGTAIAVAAVTILAAGHGIPILAGLHAALIRDGALLRLALPPVLAVAAIFAVLHPGSRRAVRLRSVGPPALAVAAVVAWDLVARGAIDADALRRSASAPAIVLLPGIVGLAATAGGVLLLPRVFRSLARRSGRAPLAVRLSLLSVARESDMPAVALILLAFGLSSIVFASGYATTLRGGVAEQAAYAAGMDIRAVGRRPFGRPAPEEPVVQTMAEYRSVADGVDPTPAVRVELATAAGRPVHGLLLDPAVLPALPGWRADFSDEAIDTIATRLTLPGRWALTGEDLATSDRLEVPLTNDGDPVRLSAVVVAPDGRFHHLALGDLRTGPQVVSAPIPDDARGGRVVALSFANGGASAAIGPETGRLQRATVAFDGLRRVVGSEPVQVEVSGATGPQLVRPPQPTDGIALPALVSRGLAQSVDAAGDLPLLLPGGAAIAVRAAAVAEHFPTMQNDGADFAVLPLAPGLVALNAIQPGAAVPGEVWIRVADERTVAVVADAMSQAPFWHAEVRSRTALAAAGSRDPFSEGVVWALLIGAAAGITLAVVGLVLAAAAHLGDDRGELIELEAQGVGPASLAALSLGRTASLLVLGVGIGIAAGVALNHLGATLLAVGADARTPVPPLRAAHDPSVALAAAGAVLVVTLGAVGVLVRRHFRGPVAWT